MAAPVSDERRLGEAIDAGARGLYRESWVLLDGVRDEALLSRALSTRGSHLRQVGDIDAALDVDRRAIACAADAQSRADARVGLAADDVARLIPAQAILDEAHEDAVQDWRTLTRWWWVGAESAMVEGRYDVAITAAEHAIDECHTHSPRHLAKSRIILGAALSAAGRCPDGPLLEAEPALAEGEWATLQWPLALVAASAVDSGTAGSALIDRLPELLAAGRRAVGLIEAHLPATLARDFAARPDIARLS